MYRTYSRINTGLRKPWKKRKLSCELQVLDNSGDIPLIVTPNRERNILLEETKFFLPLVFFPAVLSRKCCNRNKLSCSVHRVCFCRGKICSEPKQSKLQQLSVVNFDRKKQISSTLGRKNNQTRGIFNTNSRLFLFSWNFILQQPIESLMTQGGYFDAVLRQVDSAKKNSLWSHFLLHFTFLVHNKYSSKRTKSSQPRSTRGYLNGTLCTPQWNLVFHSFIWVYSCFSYTCYF